MCLKFEFDNDVANIRRNPCRKYLHITPLYLLTHLIKLCVQSPVGPLNYLESSMREVRASKIHSFYNIIALLYTLLVKGINPP